MRIAGAAALKRRSRPEGVSPRTEKRPSRLSTRILDGVRNARDLATDLSSASAHDLAAAATTFGAPLSEKARRREAEGAVEYAVECVGKRRWGRARAALLVALTLSPMRLRRAERLSILSATNPLAESRSPLLDLLQRDDLSDFASLASRLQSYRALEGLVAPLRDEWRAYASILRNRPPALLKALLAVADTAFLI